MAKKKTTKPTAPPAAANDEYVSKARPIEEFPDLLDVEFELPSGATMTFSAMAKRSRELAAEIKEREDERKEISDQIKPLMVAAEADSICGDDWGVVYTKGSKVTLSKEKLVEQGVTLDQIAAATVTSTYYYVQVRDRKEKE